jgi:hypothetical protein
MLYSECEGCEKGFTLMPQGTPLQPNTYLVSAPRYYAIASRSNSGSMLGGGVVKLRNAKDAPLLRAWDEKEHMQGVCWVRWRLTCGITST